MEALIIDNTVSFSLVLKEKLKAKGIEDVVTVENVEKGTWHLNEDKPGLVFVGNILPGVNGIDAFEILKEIAPDSYFVFMSNDLQEVDPDDLANLDSKDIIIDKENLPEFVDRVVDRYREQNKKKGLIVKIKTFLEA